MTARAPILPAPPMHTLADLARVAAEAIEHACQVQRDAAREVMEGRLGDARTTGGILRRARADASMACFGLAARLPEGSLDRFDVEAIAEACRGGYAAPEMGLRLLRSATSTGGGERGAERGLHEFAS